MIAKRDHNARLLLLQDDSCNLPSIFEITMLTDDGRLNRWASTKFILPKRKENTQCHTRPPNRQLIYTIEVSFK